MAEDVWRRWSNLDMAEWPKNCWGGRCGDQGTEEEDCLDEHRGQNGEGKVLMGTRGSPDALLAAGWMAGLRIERPNQEVTIGLMSTA